MVMFACLATGCGRKSNNIESTETATDSVAEEKVEAADEAIVEEKNTAAEDIAKETDIIDESDAANFEIVNNNAHFVRCGDKVYFRMPETLDYQDVSLWGEYADNTGISQNITEYSITDSKLNTLLRESGSGIMGISGDALFFRDVEYNNDIECEKLASIDLTKEKPIYNELCFGDDFAGVTPDGRFILALSYKYSGDGFYAVNINVYEQKECIHTYEINDFYEIAGITNESVFYRTSENLIQLDILSGDVINLGKLPVAEYGGSEVQQFEVMDDYVYIGLGFYEGTGHFYCDGYYIKAEIGVEDSISYENININSIDSDYDDIDDYDYIPFYVKNGKQISTEGIPGTTYIGYEDGYIGYYDEQGKMVEVAKGYETIYNDGDTCMIGVELAELVGDKIFLIKNTNIHVPDEDIGWRTAYMRVRAEYYMIDIMTKEIELIADIKSYDYENYNEFYEDSECE